MIDESCRLSFHELSRVCDFRLLQKSNLVLYRTRPSIFLTVFSPLLDSLFFVLLLLLLKQGCASHFHKLRPRDTLVEHHGKKVVVVELSASVAEEET